MYSSGERIMDIRYVKNRLKLLYTELRNEESSLLQNGDSDNGEGGIWRLPLVHVALYAIFIAFVEAGSVLEHIPINEILESIVCKDIHKSSGTDALPQYGDDKAVQSELALLLGWKVTISLIPGLLAAIPYGFVADRYGHKVVMILCAAGMTLARGFSITVCRWPKIFPVRLTWIAPLFTLIGGGPSVLGAVIYAGLSNLTHPSHRSTVFSYFAALSLLIRLLASLIASHLMRYDVWLPLQLSFGSAVASTIFSFFLPEIIRHKRRPDMADDDVEEAEPPADVRARIMTEDSGLQGRIQAGVLRLRENTLFLARHGNSHVLVLMLTMVTMTLSWQQLRILNQFARHKYGWSWSEAGYLVSLETGICLLLFLVVLPTASHFMSSRLSISPLAKDLTIARVSCAFVAIGAFIICLSSSAPVMIFGLVIFYLGNAYNVMLQSLVASFVKGNHAMLFNCMSSLETVGSLMAGPLVASSFKEGLYLGGLWVGLPFILSGGLSALACIMLYVIRFPSSTN